MHDLSELRWQSENGGAEKKVFLLKVFFYVTLRIKTYGRTEKLFRLESADLTKFTNTKQRRIDVGALIDSKIARE